MFKFPSIESLRNINSTVHHDANKNNMPIPTIEFVGTIKLHGSNAAIMYDAFTDTITYQKRTSLLIEDDNFGLKHEMSQMDRAKIVGLFDNLIREHGADKTYVIFGEWVGAGINSGCFLNRFDKHFVIFDSGIVDPDGENNIRLGNPNVFDHSIRVFNVNEIPTYPLTVDFNEPTQAAEIAATMVSEIEKHCPWGQYILDNNLVKVINDNDSTTGEGIVFVGKHLDNNVIFKVKGLNHKQGKPVVAVNAEHHGEIESLLDVILPEWRLEQGINELGPRDEISNKNVGDYIKWICQDIIKEESDVIEASAFDWKKISGQAIGRAKKYFFKQFSV